MSFGLPPVGERQQVTIGKHRKERSEIIILNEAEKS